MPFKSIAQINRKLEKVGIGIDRRDGVHSFYFLDINDRRMETPPTIYCPYTYQISEEDIDSAIEFMQSQSEREIYRPSILKLG